MKSILTALQFLTIFSFKKDLESTPKDLGRSMAFFPLIGLGMGGILWGLNSLLLDVFPHTVLDALLLLLLVLFSGALHLDGLADTLDGLISKKGPEEILRIMRDGRSGPTAVTGLVFYILIKYLALNSIDEEIKGAVLLLMPAIGRFSMVILAYFGDYVQYEVGVGRAFTDEVTIKEMLISLGIVCLAIALNIMPKLFIDLGFIILFAYTLWRYSYKKLGGITGDIIGAAGEMSELIFLVLVFIIY